jgi:tetratricopeptide (TPR) repeat protein
MKSISLGLLGLLCCVAGLAGEETKSTVGTEKLRDECHAYFYYTTALAEEAHKPRMELLNKAIELDPHLTRAFYNRAALFVDEGDLPRARSDFKRALALDENFIYAHYNLACVYSAESRPTDALPAWNRHWLRGTGNSTRSLLIRISKTLERILRSHR